VECVRELPVLGLRLKRMADSDIAYAMECIEEAVLRSVSEAERRRRDDWLPRLRLSVSSIYDRREGNEAFVLWQEERRAGFLWLGQGSDQFTCAPAGYLYGIYVDEGLRGKGVAKWLMSFAEDWCADNGLERLCLNVGSHNSEAEKTYRRLGFAPRSTIMEKRFR